MPNSNLNLVPKSREKEAAAIHVTNGDQLDRRRLTGTWGQRCSAHDAGSRHARVHDLCSPPVSSTMASVRSREADLHASWVVTFPRRPPRNRSTSGTDRHIEHHHTPVRRSSSPCTTCTDLSKSRWEYPRRPPGVNRSVFPSNLLGENSVNPPGGVFELGEATVQQERSGADRCPANQFRHAVDDGQRVRDLPVVGDLG